MKAFLHTQRFAEAIALAMRVVGKKESLPVLSCVLIEVQKGVVVLKSTNLESGVEIRLPARVGEIGACAVPAQVLLHALRTLRATEASIEYADNTLSLCAGGSVTEINTVPHEEFPRLPTPSSGTKFSLPVQALVGGIRAVSYAAAPSTIRPEFASIFISHKDGFLVFAATDSFRLAEKKITLPIKRNIPDILIPAKNAVDMIHLFEKNTEADALCTVAEEQLHVLAGGVSFISRVVDASFPNYEAIIPKSAETEVTLLKEDLANALHKARMFSGDTQQVGFHVYPKHKTCSLSARHASIGSMADSVDAALSGDDIDINFSIPLVQDCMQSIAADSIVIKFAGLGKPMVLKGVSDETFLYLVMPLNR